MYNKMNNKNKVLKELFLNPTHKFHLRELARETNLNPNTISNITDKLQKKGLITKIKHKNILEISLDLENKKTLIKKRIFNLSQIYASGVIDFLVDEYSPSSITLIGSYSRGEDIETSDIDIVVISGKKKVVDMVKFEKKLHRKIHLLLPKTMSEEFFNNLINGIVIYGGIRK